MTNSKRMAVHLLIVAALIGVFAVHFVSAQATNVPTEKSTDATTTAAAETSSDTQEKPAVTTSGTTETTQERSTDATTATSGGETTRQETTAKTPDKEATTDGSVKTTPSTMASSLTTDVTTKEPGTQRSTPGGINGGSKVSDKDSSSSTQGVTSSVDARSSQISSSTTSVAIGVGAGPSGLASSREGVPTGTDATASSTKAGDPSAGQKDEQIGVSPAARRDLSVWEANEHLFIPIIVACCPCLFVALVYIITTSRLHERFVDTSDKEPIGVEVHGQASQPVAVPNPIPDEEIVKDEGPMLERENPAVTENGAGQLISKPDEDNGWVVPMDQLSTAEKAKPEVENTRL